MAKVVGIEYVTEGVMFVTSENVRVNQIIITQNKLHEAETDRGTAEPGNESIRYYLTNYFE